MKRRKFITLLGGAVAWPLAARAQHPAMPIIGYLSVHSAAENRRILIEFRRGLSDADYGEDRNVAFEYRWAVGQFPRLPELAADLVRRRVAVIVTPSSLGETLAAKAATTTIPIVFAAGVDPVKYGLVASLNRPGSNLTGVSLLTAEIASKRLSILGELAPQATTIAFLAGGRQALTFEDQTSDLLAAASSLGRRLTVLEVRGAGEFDAAFSTLVESRAGALVVGAFPLFFDQRNRDTILQLAARHKIPAIYPSRLFADAGGLISYGPGAGVFRQLAVDYVAPILKGAKPADLPVRQSTNIALTINLKTANALGLEIPATLLAIADDVIE